MKKIFLSLSFSVVILILLFSFSSCGEENSAQPAIEFVVASSLVSKDTTLEQGTVFTIGIKAQKSGTEGLLTSCKISRSINSGADSTIQQAYFVTQGFTQFYSYTAGDSSNTERYTFTVIKQDGVSNSVNLTVTDN